MKLHGWNGRILWVDLNNGKTREERLDKNIYENFIGGKGLGTYLLYKNVLPGINPLGLENTLFFMTGPMQGLPAPNVGRWTLVTKSPLSGLFLDTHSGGALGREIKKAGYDALCVTGKSDEPVILRLHDDDLAIERADHLWGKDVYTTTEMLHEQIEKSTVYTIGPAGERLSRIATGCCEIHHQTGRGGAGAVLGSKNLKAVVVRGTKEIEAANVDAIREINKSVSKLWNEKENVDFKQYGTPFLVEVANEMGQFPTRNFQTGYFEDHLKIVPEVLEQWALGARNSCPHCVMRCTRAYKTNDPDDPSSEVESTIEYETLGLMGGCLGISDPQMVLKLNYMADKLGLDTISSGSTIGFAMDAIEKGILTEEDIGFSLKFGDGEAAIKLLRMIAYREGVGDILADGVRVAAKKIGKDSDSLAVHFKGLEVPAWDPRGRKGMGLSYATANVGASHLRGWPSTSDPTDSSAIDVVESMLTSRDQKTLTDSLVVCHFTYHIPLSHQMKIDLLNAATGLSYNEESVKLFARRVHALARMFNHREGISREDDIIPPRLWEPEISGPREGMKSFLNESDFEACLDRFYEIRGYNKEDGLPTADTLKLLSLDAIV
ncbi:MAG: aldehyde ferredoxin oxidoreductase family protein [Candidatus Thorarchaeota archaeon]